MIFIVRRHSKWGICAKGSPKTKNLKPGWGGILTEGFFAVRGPHSNWGGGIFGIRGGILTFILTVYIYIIILYTSSTAQGGGGSFKHRKPIGEIGCCESRMAERMRIHWWTERWLRSPLSLSFSDYQPTYLPIYLCIYLSIDLSIYLICLSNIV